jgi:ribosomal protein S27AE
MDSSEEGPSDNTTLTEVVDSYRSSGFASDFFAEAGSRVRCGRCSAVIDAHTLAMHSMRRLEGASDPDDMVAVIATSCPVCGADGTLVLGFGPAASEEDSDVLADLRDQRLSDVLPAGASPDETPDAVAEQPSGDTANEEAP